ncbi:hypothetical protein PC116_g31010 [Phytophthora cactorum]|nr:hypothetical protein PC116_g31010 [Phytophthora cactorum]
MSYRGHWYLKSLPVLSRYFTREPAEKAAIISGEEHDPYDLVLVIKDAHTLQEPEDFVEAVMRELANTGEYSRDMAAHDQIGVWGARATRRTHTNLAGRDLLEDFDLIIEELINLQCELERSNRANSADRLFETIADAYGWDSTELKKSGFHQEIMTYVSQAMTGRLRYMRDSARWNSPPGQQNQTIGDEPSIVLSTRYFSSALHSACIADDIRTVEWFSNWAALFPGRHSREFSSPKIDTNMILELFQQVYLTPYKNAVRLGE